MGQFEEGKPVEGASSIKEIIPVYGKIGPKNDGGPEQKEEEPAQKDSEPEQKVVKPEQE